MTYTKEQFISDVKAEAAALRQHATKEERGRLDIDILDPDNPLKCIYGLMTGDCHSERAAELISNCCRRYFTNNLTGNPISKGFESILERVNGEVVDNIIFDRGDLKHLSSVEVYLFQPDAQNANLISYLRGETDDLNL